MKEEFSKPRLNDYVYEYNGEAVALLSLGNTADEDKNGAYEVWRIYVDEAYKGIGIGSELLQFAEEQALQKGYKEVVIWAFKENKRALKFYKKHGYVKDKEDYLGEPYCADAVRLNKKI